MDCHNSYYESYNIDYRNLILKGSSITLHCPHSWLITGFVTRLTRQVPLVGQELLPFRSTWVHPRFLMGSFYSIFSFVCMFCRSLFVLLYFFLLASKDTCLCDRCKLIRENWLSVKVFSLSLWHLNVSWYILKWEILRRVWRYQRGNQNPATLPEHLSSPTVFNGFVLLDL
jgi:hypothetical protein